MRTAGGAALLLACVAALSAQAGDAACTTDPNGDLVCELEVGGPDRGASDLGVYNVSLVLDRVAGAPEEPLSPSVAIDASECGQPARRFVEERVRLAADQRRVAFNFPLLLHATGTAGRYCLQVRAFGCGGGCASRIGLAIGESAVMRQRDDPRTR